MFQGELAQGHEVPSDGGTTCVVRSDGRDVPPGRPRLMIEMRFGVADVSERRPYPLRAKPERHPCHRPTKSLGHRQILPHIRDFFYATTAIEPGEIRILLDFGLNFFVSLRLLILVDFVTLGVCENPVLILVEHV